jgi:hypothetical protein
MTPEGFRSFRIRIQRDTEALLRSGWSVMKGPAPVSRKLSPQEVAYLDFLERLKGESASDGL